MEDIIVNEVRNAGIEILKKNNFDIDKYYDHLKFQENEKKNQGWRFSTPDMNDKIVVKA